MENLKSLAEGLAPCKDSISTGAGARDGRGTFHTKIFCTGSIF